MLGLCLLMAFASLTVFGEGGLTDLLHLRSEQRRLEARLLDQQQHNDELRAKIVRLESDDRYIERTARTKLGMVKPGEIIFRDRGAATRGDH